MQHARPISNPPTMCWQHAEGSPVTKSWCDLFRAPDTSPLSPKISSSGGPLRRDYDTNFPPISFIKIYGKISKINEILLGSLTHTAYQHNHIMMAQHYCRTGLWYHASSEAAEAYSRHLLFSQHQALRQGLADVISYRLRDIL